MLYLNKLLKTILPLTLIFLAAASSAWGREVVYSSGIANEATYRELVWVTGEPIVAEGTITVSSSAARGGISPTTRISVKLENKDKGLMLNRNITYRSSIAEIGDQKITSSEVDRFSETITIGSDRYNLVEFTFSQSVVEDSRPAATYFSGDWKGRQVYDHNRGEGRLTVDIAGTTVGYDNPWSSTETLETQYNLAYRGKKLIEREQDGSPTSETYEQIWSGTAATVASLSTRRNLSYRENYPQEISFAGGFLESTDGQQSIRYNYNLPNFDQLGLVQDWYRNRGTGSTGLALVPAQKRLPVYNLADIDGHWAGEAINKMVSLGVFDQQGAYFGPGILITRGEFAAALARVLELEDTAPETAPPPVRGRGLPPAEENENPSPFVDVSPESSWYDQILAMADSGVMQGVGQGRFGPEESLTRAQAVTSFVRALGLERLAKYNQPTGFADDDAVPAWARQAVAVARQIGLVEGDALGKFNPHEKLTRAESAVILSRLVDYLSQDLQREYREIILLFRS